MRNLSGESNTGALPFILTLSLKKKKFKKCDSLKEQENLESLIVALKLRW